MHWLPVPQCIEFKISMWVCRCQLDDAAFHFPHFYRDLVALFQVWLIAKIFAQWFESEVGLFLLYACRHCLCTGLTIYLNWPPSGSARLSVRDVTSIYLLTLTWKTYLFPGAWLGAPLNRCLEMALHKFTEWNTQTWSLFCLLVFYINTSTCMFSL